MRVTTFALAVASFAACTTNSDDAPIEPSGGVGGGSTGSDSSLVTGHVCEVVDPRAFTGCAASAPAGLAVSLAGHVTLTDSTGGFTLPTPDSEVTNPTFQVSGPGVVTAITTYVDGIPEVVPVVSSSLYQQMLANSGVTATAGQGAVLMQVTDGSGVPIPGVTATLSPSPASGPFYDGSAATSFQSQSTGVDGVMWAPGSTVGPVNVTLTNPQSGGETTVDGIQVVDGGITFLSTPIGGTVAE